MIQLEAGPDRVEVLSPVSWGIRVFFGLIALVPLLAPYELLWRVGWTTYWHPFFLFAALVSAGAVTVSGLFAFAALAGISSRMTFDVAGSSFIYTRGAPVVPWRTFTFPLSAVERVSIRTRDWSDGPPSFSLRIELSGGATFESGPATSRQEIERVLEAVQEVAGRARGST